MAKNQNEDIILQALLSTRTVTEAAKSANVSIRTIYNYLEDPAFEARYKAARGDIVRGVANHLLNQANEAVDVICAIMRDTSSRTQERLSAAKFVLNYTDKYIENNIILERIEKLESLHKGAKNEQNDIHETA